MPDMHSSINCTDIAVIAQSNSQVSSLQSQNLCSTERLRAVSEKNQELSDQSQKMHEHNDLLIKCIGELSVVCKRKEATLQQLRHCIQTADTLSDIPLPPVEQVGFYAWMLVHAGVDMPLWHDLNDSKPTIHKLKVMP